MHSFIFQSIWLLIGRKWEKIFVLITDNSKICLSLWPLWPVSSRVKLVCGWSEAAVGREESFLHHWRSDGRMKNLLVLLKWSSRLKRKGEDSVAEALIKCVRLIICVGACVWRTNSPFLLKSARAFCFRPKQRIRCKSKRVDAAPFMTQAQKHKSVINTGGSFDG